MKPHLPLPLFNALLNACFRTAALVGGLMVASGTLHAESKYYIGKTGQLSYAWGTAGGALERISAQKQNTPITFSQYDELAFLNCSADIAGGAIFHPKHVTADYISGYCLVAFSPWGGINISDVTSLRFENNYVGSYHIAAVVPPSKTSSSSVYVQAPATVGSESSDFDFRYGQGGAVYGVLTLSNCQDVLFKGNTAQGFGGAILGDFEFEGQGKEAGQKLVFDGNRAVHGNGGAICENGSGYCMIERLSQVTFSNNYAQCGGALAKTQSTFAVAKIAGSGDVVITGNKADAYGGAIYGTCYLQYNDRLLLQNNCAGQNGSAIYGSDISISGNSKVEITDNYSDTPSAAALYSTNNLFVTENHDVVFRNNGVAFRAPTAYLSTTTNSASRINIYEPFNVTTLDLNRNSAKGSIVLSGKKSVGTVKDSAVLRSGTLALKDGAVLNVANNLQTYSRANVTLEQGTLLDVKGSLTLDSYAYILFELNGDQSRQGGSAPMLCVDKATLSSDPFKLTWMQDSSPFIQSYDLMEVGTSFTYRNKTYTYQDAAWWQGGEMKSAAEMNKLFPSQNNLSYFWDGNILCAAASGYTIDSVGVRKGLTWRGDELQPYNTQKRYLTSNHQDRSDESKCWVAAACNALQYWQDQYAPLYRSDYLVTNRRLDANPSADELYRFMDICTDNVGGNEYSLISWWLRNPGQQINKTRAEASEILPSYILRRTNSGPWQHLDFDINYERVAANTDLCAHFRKHLNGSASPVLLDYGQRRDGVDTYGHVVTVWGADFARNESGQEVLKTLYVTDSDRGNNVFSVPVTYVNNEAYYYYKDDNNYDKIKALMAFSCLDNIDSMLDDYYSLDTALQWTGTAKNSIWDASSVLTENSAHLAEPDDGWQKACTGSGKTIYAHAYFTKENAPSCQFEFGNKVGGQPVWQKNVVLAHDLHVKSVQFSGTDYTLSGRHTLSAETLSITPGADLRLLGGASIGTGTVVTLDGTLRVDKGSSVNNCGIIMSASGTLWGAGLTLTRVSAPSNDTVNLNLFDNYSCKASDVRLSGCNISRSGVLGCTLDLQGAAVRVTFASNSLCQLVYNKLQENNNLLGNWDDYRYDFEVQQATLEASYAEIKERPVALADSSLTVEAKDNSWVTFASYSKAPDLAGTDINLSETWRTEVTAPQLVTAQGAAVLLNEQSVLNTKSLIVTANSSFKNEGTLHPLDGKGAVTVQQGATLSGSGKFAAVVSSGKLIVGSSPGAPLYESLTLNSGSTTVFYLDGTTPATAEDKGWGRGLHSVMNVSGDLLMAAGANITLGCSADFLSGIKVGESVTLTLIRSGQGLSDSLLPLLQENTVIRLADTDDTLLKAEDYGIVVRNHEWSFNEDNTAASISLSFASGSAGAVIFQGGNEAVAWSDIGQKEGGGTNDTPVSFYEGGHVVLDGAVQPGDMVVSTPEELIWSGSGSLQGNADLLKENTGRLVLDVSSPDYEGSVTITGGVLETRRADALGKGNVNLYGATLQTPAARLNCLEIADEATILGGGSASAIRLYDGVAVHAQDGFTLAEGGTLLLEGQAEWLGDVSFDDAYLVFSGGELSVTGTLTLFGAGELSLGDYEEAGRYSLIHCNQLIGDWDSLAVTQRDESFLYELVQEATGLTLVVRTKTPEMYWGYAKGTWKEGGRFGTDAEGRAQVFRADTYVGFTRKAAVTISGKVKPRAVAVDTDEAVTFTADRNKAGSGIAGAGTLTKDGKGTLTLNSGNTYTGGTVINAGTVKAGGVSSFGTGEITLNGGTLNLGKYAVANAINVNGPANLKGTAYKGALTINGNLGSVTNFYLGKNATLNRGKVSGVLTGAAGVSVKGEGTLAGKNTYKGTTAVQAGGLLHLTGTVAGNISVSGTLDSTSRTLTPASGKTLTVNNGGVVKGLVNVASSRTLVMKGTESSVGSINLNAGTAVFDSTAAAQVFSGTGVFSFNGHKMSLKAKSTVKSAAATPMTLHSGSITLTSSKGYSGPVTLKGGTLNLGAIAWASPVTVDGTANLIGTAYKGALTVNGTLAGSTNIYLGKTATLNGGTVKGILKGKGGVVVRGESTLANKNTYTGTTNIQSGATLHLTGSVAGNIVVNSDATLDNAKAVSLTKGRTMKVMDGATVTGGITVGSGATLAVYGDESKLGSTTINGGTAVFDSTAAAVVGTGAAALTVNGHKVTVKAKSTLKMAADEDITLRSGKLVLNSTSTTYTGDLLAQGGTLDLASRTVKNDVYLGNAVLMNGNALSGTLHVQNANSRYSGSLTLTSAKKLDFEAGAKLTVTGTLTLKGGTALTLSGDDWEEGQYTLMSCGTLSGKAATAFKVTGAEGFDAAIRSSGKNIILTLTAIPEAKQSPGLTTACATLAAPDLTTACETLAEPELTAAAEEPQPLALSTEEEEMLTATAYAPDSYAAMQELAPTAEALVQSDWALVDTTRAFTASIRNRSMGTLTQDGKGAIWANSIGSFSRLGSVNGHSGSQTNVYGGSIGAEHVFGEHHTLGVALGSTHAMVGGTSLGKLRQNATHLALYGNSRLGSKFSADWAAAFGTATIHANMGANRGKWEQNSGELTARLTYTETLSDRTALRTFAGLDYDATGADRVNGYKTGSVQALRGEVGIGLTHAAENAVLYAEIGMVGDMVRHNPTVESAHFRLQGANPGRTGFRATLGGSIKLNDTWSANAAYNLETAAHATQQSVNVGVSRKF